MEPCLYCDQPKHAHPVTNYSPACPKHSDICWDEDENGGEYIPETTVTRTLRILEMARI